MKKLTIVSFLIFITIIKADNEQKSNAPEGSNTIIVTTTDDATTAFRNIGRLLTSEGFEIQTSDINLMQLTTKHKKETYGFLGGKKYYLALIVQIDEIDKKAIITIKGTSDLYAVTAEIQKYAGGGIRERSSEDLRKVVSGKLDKEFERMFQIAIKIKNQNKIEYKVE